MDDIQNSIILPSIMGILTLVLVLNALINFGRYFSLLVCQYHKKSINNTYLNHLWKLVYLHLLTIILLFQGSFPLACYFIEIYSMVK